MESSTIDTTVTNTPSIGVARSSEGDEEDEILPNDVAVLSAEVIPWYEKCLGTSSRNILVGLLVFVCCVQLGVMLLLVFPVPISDADDSDDVSIRQGGSSNPSNKENEPKIEVFVQSPIVVTTIVPTSPPTTTTSPTALSSPRPSISSFDHEKWHQFEPDLSGSSKKEFFGWALSLSADGQTVVAGSIGTDMAHVFSRRGDKWEPVGNSLKWISICDVIFSSMYRGESFLTTSLSLSYDGKRIAVGSPSAESVSRGKYVGELAVYEFHLHDNAWHMLGKPISGDNAGHRFGMSVSMSDNGQIVAVGAPENNANGESSGAVRILSYDYAMNRWTRLGNDIVGEKASSFGRRVCLSGNGNRVAVAAKRCITIYDLVVLPPQLQQRQQQQNHYWKEMAHIIYYDEDEKPRIAMSRDGSTIAIGSCHFNNKQGRVRVYRLDEETKMWMPLGLEFTGPGHNNQFGTSISLSTNGNRLAVGARCTNEKGIRVGMAQVFEYDSTTTTWQQVGCNLYGVDRFDEAGTSVSLSGNGTVVAIGSPFRDNVIVQNRSKNDDAGHIRIFQAGE